MIVKNVSYSQHLKNDLTYKRNWGTTFGEFKKIFYHVLGTWQNEDYWAMSPQDKVAHHLP